MIQRLRGQRQGAWLPGGACTRRANSGGGLHEAIEARNRRLPDFKRVHRYLLWDGDFPRTASMKIKRNQLADTIRQQADSESEAVTL